MNNTTVDALKDVYTELGGSAATVASMQTDAEVIEALSALVGSTIELPAVTSEDNGDVLTVVEGEWAKATPSALPSVTSEDNGDVLTVVEGEWSKASVSNDYVRLVVTKNGTEYPTGLTLDELKELVQNKIVEIYETTSKQVYKWYYSSTANGGEVYFWTLFLNAASPLTFTISRIEYASNYPNGRKNDYTLKSAT